MRASGQRAPGRAVAAPPGPSTAPTLPGAPLSTPAATAGTTGTAPAATPPPSTPPATAGPATTVPVRPTGRPNPSRANLALGRPVTASGSEGHPWPPDAVVDGRPDTRWSSAFTDRQWISVDLGGTWSVSQVRLVWEHAYATRYTVEVSVDGRAWSAVYTTASGAGGTVDVEAGGVPARFVRLVCTRRSSSYGYSLFEIEVR
ncbi:hypothetical protein Psuf_084010 [Phytohabitans suffuscus]|uniref:F5/8 type C domain-containing protein n=1 Tax=Phytohabitans suffuscus TaxID=624315 RepID=A0A6F8YYT0_9ACTN|nr:discoidin domain-containing protein [Phytohabitans suffuscus]BCB91088.1 hypothetical protein Psuf_084010 [Phytohabitans suffuscus]